MPIDQSDLEHLNALREVVAGKGQVLSLYLPLDATPALDRGYVALAKDVLKPFEGDKHAHPEDVTRVLSYIQEAVPHGRTLALFSSTANNLFEVFRLQVPLPAVARLDSRPYLLPLDAARDNYPTVAVVALDEHEARILLTDLTEIQSGERVRDDVPDRQRQGGWAAFKFERDRAEHVRAHFRHVAEAVQDLYRVTPFKRLVVGGASETAAAFVEALPKDLQGLVAGTLPIEMFDSDNNIVAAALPVAEAAERREEIDLVTEIREGAFGGGKASLGWDETLQTLREGRVRRLALAEGHLGTSQADQAVQLAWDTDARVEFLRGEAEEMLADNGGIGALLRY